jgi:hypothetical protein
VKVQQDIIKDFLAEKLENDNRNKYYQEYFE